MFIDKAKIFVKAGNGGNGPDSEGYYNADYEDKTGK